MELYRPRKLEEWLQRQVVQKCSLTTARPAVDIYTRFRNIFDSFDGPPDQYGGHTG